MPCLSSVLGVINSRLPLWPGACSAQAQYDVIRHREASLCTQTELTMITLWGSWITSILQTWRAPWQFISTASHVKHFSEGLAEKGISFIVTWRHQQSFEKSQRWNTESWCLSLTAAMEASMDVASVVVLWEPGVSTLKEEQTIKGFSWCFHFSLNSSGLWGAPNVTLCTSRWPGSPGSYNQICIISQCLCLNGPPLLKMFSVGSLLDKCVSKSTQQIDLEMILHGIWRTQLTVFQQMTLELGINIQEQ